MPKERRYDLDWIRVIVFDLLILYHVGMFFVPWEYHLENNVTSESLVLPMFFLGEWRLPILFVVSGMGTRFALSFRSGTEFLKERLRRLLIPLVFGMLVIVYPQVYLERLADGTTTDSFFAFYPHYFDGVYPAGNFSWHHLWFLPYLLCYSILLTPLFLYLRHRHDSQLVSRLKELVRNRPLILYLCILPLAVVDLTLGPLFPVTRALFNDWYAFVYYGTFFLYGFLLIMIKDVLWEAVRRIKWMTLAMGLVLFPTLLWLFDTDANDILTFTVRSANTWSWILAVLGFSSQYLNRPSKVLSYRNQAVYPFYILHQTVLMLFAFCLMDASMSIPTKFLIITAGTFGGTWLIYEFLVRRVRALHLPFGLKKSKDVI